MEIPTRVELEPKDASALLQLQTRVQSIQKFVQTVTEQGEKRLYDLQRDTAEFWKMAAEKYGLDIDRVNYTLGPDAKSAVPIAMRFEVEDGG